MDGRGVPIRASIDEPLLRKIAADNGGIYSNAASLKGMEKALEDVNRLYGVTLITPPETIVKSYASPIAYVVLAILVLWLALELFSITGAFHVSRYSGIALTSESMNYSTVAVLVWGKRVFLIIGK